MDKARSRACSTTDKVGDASASIWQLLLLGNSLGSVSMVLDKSMSVCDGLS